MTGKEIFRGLKEPGGVGAAQATGRDASAPGPRTTEALERSSIMGKLYTNSDTQIQQNVLRELQWDSRVEETDAGVAVHEGVVTLTGTVGNVSAKQAAAEAAHRVAGVLDVANDLLVKIPGAGPRTDTELAQAVRRTLEWDTLVPHERVQSTVSNGWVMLTGTVDHGSHREAVERAVRYLRGISGVTNQLTINGPPVRRSIQWRYGLLSRRRCSGMPAAKHGI